MPLSAAEEIPRWRKARLIIRAGTRPVAVVPGVRTRLSAETLCLSLCRRNGLADRSRASAHGMRAVLYVTCWSDGAERLGGLRLVEHGIHG